jgi:hypothetical protein
MRSPVVVGGLGALEVTGTWRVDPEKPQPTVHLNAGRKAKSTDVILKDAFGAAAILKR